VHFYLCMFQLSLTHGLAPDPGTVTQVHEALELLNKFLEGQDWLAGSNVTIADFAVLVTVSFAEVCIHQKLS
jgi:glutathione S-transferase